MKIAIFYHIAQIGLGAFIYQQQLHRLYTSGLIKESDYIHFGVNGDQELFNVPEKAIVQVNSNWKEETDTLISLRDFCKESQDYNVLYFHTKGVSKGTLAVNSWRLMMEYYLIDRWKDCVKELENYDCVGANLNPVGDTIWSNGEVTKPTEGTYNYTGNFWWARASHIQTLNDKFLLSDYRIDRELWIGSNPNSNPTEIYREDGFDFYTDLFLESRYIK